jgi:hypothetical protein
MSDKADGAEVMSSEYELEPARAPASEPLIRDEARPARELVHGALGRPSADELTQLNICAALLAANDVDARRVEVEMTGRGVVLRGVVATATERERALEIAREHAGRHAVREALVIERDAATPRSAIAPHTRQ